LAHPGPFHEIDALTQQIAREPRNGTLYLERAYRERLDGRLEEALADLDRAAVLAPSDIRPSAERGIVLSALGRDREAEMALTRFLEGGGQTAPVFAERGKVRVRLGRIAEAIDDLSSAIRIGPDPDLYLTRGALQEKL